MNTDIYKVLLISPPWYRIFGASSVSSPLGLCHIAAVLEEHGYDVSVYNADYKTGLHIATALEKTNRYSEYLRVLKDIDHPLWKEAETVITKQSPDIVGVSVMTAKYDSALNISRLVKRFDADIPVVWGGGASHNITR